MYKTFEAQAAAHAARYYRLKAAGVCTSCGIPDERTGRGCARCQACYDKTKDRRREYSRMVYAERKSRGVCTYCGKVDAYTMVGRSLCAECCEKDLERQRKRHGWKPRESKSRGMPNIPAWERPSYGLCYYCGEPVADRVKNNGKRVHTCERCWQRCRNNAKNAKVAWYEKRRAETEGDWHGRKNQNHRETVKEHNG